MRRRQLMLGTAGTAPLPRFANAQSAQHPSVTVAVQIITISGTPDPMREPSNVGFRIMPLLSEPMIAIDWRDTRRVRPTLATVWRPVDARTLEPDAQPWREAA
jgi:peptide/nickel transport system substrate-binding protein